MTRTVHAIRSFPYELAHPEHTEHTEHTEHVGAAGSSWSASARTGPSARIPSDGTGGRPAMSGRADG
ncbi:hypothetical protein [Streptomyces sp. NPDC088785]|uniref:hypothetical protein n=1 Tax=Streptomyces sp. NPDC088785 TaxID=3365897 RepID=UPI00381BBEDA